ncbi:MAG: hypothetical protein ACJAYU_000550 [Bradymonadia bacterium]|jgi:hypothetical protein
MNYPSFLIICALAGFIVSGCSSEVPASCDPELCVYPPPPVCDGDQLVTSLPVGVCAGDTCVYQPSPEACEFGCEAGACLDATAACRGIECNELPDASCDGTWLITWADGLCEAGACSYVSSNFDCASAGEQCLDGRCEDLCLDVVCEPQPASCDAAILITSAEFYCDGGQCLAATVDRFDCASITDGATCLDGECITPDACDGVPCTDPPEDWCERFVLHSYAAIGECVPDAGHCAYLDTTTNCAAAGDVCVVDASGASCVSGDPCLGISCEEAPASFCLENEEAPEGAPLTLRRIYGADGTCTLGECWHESVVEDCADSDSICVRGECVQPDPCDDLRCPSVPRRICDGDVAVELVRDTGICVDGECLYDEIRRNCTDDGLFCSNGICTVVGRCAGVVCATPPISYCFGNEAIEYVPIGICDDGDCYYEPIVQDCEARFDICVEGECVDP